MKKTRKGSRAVDLLYLAGAALIAVGAGLIFVPAGLIVAGCFALAASVLADRSAGEYEGDTEGGEDG